MAWDFPNTPAENDRFTPVAGGPIYIYKAPAWELVTITGVTIGDAPPANPVVGQTWFESDTGSTYLYYDDGNSKQWVQISGASGLPEAPVDSKSYARKDGAWADVATSFVVKAGDTMTGALTIAAGAATTLSLNAGAPGRANQIAASNGTGAAGLRWLMQLGDGAAEGGSNLGSNFALHSYSDTGTFVGTPLTIARTNGNATMQGIYANTLVLAHANGLGGVNNNPGMSCDASNGMIVENGPTQPLSVNRLGSNGTAVYFMQSATGCGSITVANASSTAYNTSSDGRLKEDRQAFDAGPLIDATNVYNFQWKDTEVRGYGVIAQEAVDVFPDAVTHDEEHDMWGVDYSKYVPLLLQEIKMLRARVAALEAA